ncbi:MAG: hypothetical protein ACE5J5_02040 [Candidatus Hydrothermarchaeales archaeon]
MEVCNVCGISEVQTEITPCMILGHNLCPLCCLLSRGDRLLESCNGCEFAHCGEIGA